MASTIGRGRCDDDCSIIGDKGEIGFIDFEDDESVCFYDPNEEGPVVISIPFPFIRGKPRSVFVGETSAHSITLENTTSEAVELWGVTIFCSNPADSFTLSLLEPPSAKSDQEYVRSFLEGFSLEDRVLQPHRTQTIWLSCKPKDIGLHTSIVHFDVGDDRIDRVVFLLAEDKVSQSLAANKPYTRVPRRKQFSVDENVAASCPAKATNRGLKYKIPEFEIPQDVRELLENKLVPEVITEGLRRENYANYFNTLLIMEELHLEKEMRSHDMECVTMRRKWAHLLALEVPGLAERRPSLVRGDFVFAKLASCNENDMPPASQMCIRYVSSDIGTYPIRILRPFLQLDSINDEKKEAKKYKKSPNISFGLLKQVKYLLEFQKLYQNFHCNDKVQIKGKAVVGDVVFAEQRFKGYEKHKARKYIAGCIYRIEADEVLLKFAKEFHTYHRYGDLYNIQFTYNRVNMRRLYQAVQAAESLESNLLFPSHSTIRSIKTTPIVSLMSLNEEQLHAVKMILGCEGAPPYVIHGPPGTGKTMTLVEAILQLYTTRKNAHILVCAPSNSAADHILERLVGNAVAEVKENEIFRLNASSRVYEDVQPNNIRFCYFEDSIFKCPPLKALLRYRVIISTYTSSSLLYKEGIGRGHFSHIFLDEAGQASEPETMVPMSNLCQRETVVVLAGDPKQLGPVVYSSDAVRFGLGKSYLERLFEYEYYHNGDESFITRLLRNYRCHPAILDLPSKLFYKGELIACKEDTLSLKSCLCSISRKEFPVLFIGIQGSDEREGNNPSWFNRIEASKVVDLIKKLSASTDIRETDIGLITPYRQQVVKITKVLESMEIPDVKVGSVEQFQGQEREIIIVSTVRSTVKHNEFDRTFCLGFLSNPRRFNVAITRAKSLLIIVGNPHIVSKDPYWNKLLWYCSDNHSYEGCPLPERQLYADADLNLGKLAL